MEHHTKLGPQPGSYCLLATAMQRHLPHNCVSGGTWKRGERCHSLAQGKLVSPAPSVLINACFLKDAGRGEGRSVFCSQDSHRS